MAELVEIKDLIAELGYEATLDLLVRQLNYTINEAQYVMEFELGNTVTGDVVNPQDRE